MKWTLHQPLVYPQSCTADQCTSSEKEPGCALNVNVGSNDPLPHLHREAKNGSSTRKHVCLNNDILVSSLCSSSVPHVGVLTGIPVVLTLCKMGLLHVDRCAIKQLAMKNQKDKRVPYWEHLPSCLPSLQLSHGFWNHTDFSEVQCDLPSIACHHRHPRYGWRQWKKPVDKAAVSF